MLGLKWQIKKKGLKKYLGPEAQQFRTLPKTIVFECNIAQVTRDEAKILRHHFAVNQTVRNGGGGFMTEGTCTCHLVQICIKIRIGAWIMRIISYLCKRIWLKDVGCMMSDG